MTKFRSLLLASYKDTVGLCGIYVRSWQRSMSKWRQYHSGDQAGPGCFNRLIQDHVISIENNSRAAT